MARSALFGRLAIVGAVGGGAYWYYQSTQPPVDLGPKGAAGFSWHPWTHRVKTIKENTDIGTAATIDEAVQIVKSFFNAGTTGAPATPPATGATGTNAVIDLGPQGAPGFAWNSASKQVVTINEGTLVGTADSIAAAVAQARRWFGGSASAATDTAPVA